MKERVREAWTTRTAGRVELEGLSKRGQFKLRESVGVLKGAKSHGMWVGKLGTTYYHYVNNAHNPLTQSGHLTTTNLEYDIVLLYHALGG